MRIFLRYAATWATLALTEMTAHLLSVGWGMAVLLAAFAWVALTGASVAAKARSTEDRVNALVPAVGAVRVMAVNAQSAASTAQGTANSAQSTANNALPSSGGTITGTLNVNGDHHVGGTLYGVSGTLTVGDSVQANSNLNVNGGGTVNGNFNAAGGITGAGGGTLENASSIHSSGVIQADTELIVSGQRIAPGQGTPGGYPVVGGTYTTGTSTLINAIITGLQAAGIFS